MTDRSAVLPVGWIDDRLADVGGSPAAVDRPWRRGRVEPDARAALALASPYGP